MAISIRNHEIEESCHDLYDVIFDTDEILTLVTSAPYIVDDWISKILHIHRRRLNHLIVGLDVEWRPNFIRGSNYRNPIATLQLCVGRHCLIFQIIYAPEIPQSLIDFLGDESFKFVGVGINEDAEKLYNDYGLDISKMVDLRYLAAVIMRRSDLRNAGLKSLAREVLGKEIDKPTNITLSCWDDEWLSMDQVSYACVDAFISFQIARSLYG